MTSFAILKQQCDALNGYEETGGPSGHDGNVTKIWAELDPPLQGASWCAAGVSYLWKHAGHPFPAVDKPYGFVYCPDAVTYARHAGLWDTSGRYAPGDTVFFCWNGSGTAEHVGVVISDDGQTLRTFECNTMPSAGGDQANGGGAYYKTRPHGPTVLGVLKSSRWLTASPPPAPAPRGKTNPYPAPTSTLSQGASDHRTNGPVHWVQWAVGVPCDGEFGPATKANVVRFQQHHNLTPDGVVGPKTEAVMRGVTH